MTYLALNGNTVLWTMILLALTIICSIVGLKYYWKNKFKKSVSRSDDCPLKNTGGLHAFGICIALISAITLMSWTQTERVMHNYIVEGLIPIIELEIPITMHVKPKSKPLPPPPPENLIIEEVGDLIEIVEPKQIPIEIPIDMTVVESENAVLDISPPVVLPPLPPSQDGDVVDPLPFVIVEQMPRFPGCESQNLTEDEKFQCSERELMTYIANNLKYPVSARENGIEGRVFVEFVVDKKGDLTRIKVMRDIGAGCGAAAMKVVSTMVKEKGFWTPGMQRGKKVKVKYTIPITFKLSK